MNGDWYSIFKMGLVPNFWSLINFLHAFLTEVDFSCFRIKENSTEKKLALFTLLNSAIWYEICHILTNILCKSIQKMGAHLYCENSSDNVFWTHHSLKYKPRMQNPECQTFYVNRSSGPCVLLRAEFRQPFLDSPWPCMVKIQLQNYLCKADFKSLMCIRNILKTLKKHTYFA